MIYVVDTGDGVAASDHIPSLSPDTYTSNGMCTNNNGKNWQPVNWIIGCVLVGNFTSFWIESTKCGFNLIPKEFDTKK